MSADGARENKSGVVVGKLSFWKQQVCVHLNPQSSAVVAKKQTQNLRVVTRAEGESLTTSFSPLNPDLFATCRLIIYFTSSG